MNWAQARLILLLTYTLVNGLLAYLLWAPGVPKGNAMEQLAPHQVEAVRARLRDQGIRLLAEVPTSRPSVPLLRLSPPSPQVRGELMALLSRMAAADGKEMGPGGTGEVTEESTGVIRWRPVPPLPLSGSVVRPAQLRRAGEQLLTRAGVAGLGVVTWSRAYSLEPGRTALEFVPTYKGLPLFTGFVRLVLNEDRWEEILAYLPAVVEERGAPKAVLAAPEALLRWAGRVHSGTNSAGPEGQSSVGNAVTQMELGYYASHPDQARAWDTVPTWRIVVESGAFYYVNGYTGELEQP